MEINNAVAVVTGGASGLGLATAKALLDKGALVVILDLPTSNGEDGANELGDRVRFAAADVTDEEAVAAALGGARRYWPPAGLRNTRSATDFSSSFGDSSGVTPSLSASAGRSDLASEPWLSR